MQIRRPKRHEVSRINELFAMYGLRPIEPSHINHRDVSLVAEDGDKIVGFLWVGLMRQNKEGYINHFIVDKGYSKKGVGKRLAMTALETVKKLGVEEVFGIIAHDEFYERSAFNSLRMAIGSDGLVYTQVKAQIKHMEKELGVSNGR